MLLTKDTVIAFFAVIWLALAALLLAGKTQSLIQPQDIIVHGTHVMPNGEQMNDGGGQTGNGNNGGDMQGMKM